MQLIDSVEKYTYERNKDLVSEISNEIIKCNNIIKRYKNN